MKVILQKDVPNLGDAGDVKDVANGYARNFLLPGKWVIPYREGSARAAEHQQLIIRRKVEKRTRDMETLATELNSIGVLEIPVRVGARQKLFGSVTSIQIAQVLKGKGYSIDKRKIEMGEKIRALGDYKVKLKLADSISISADIRVTADEASVEVMKEEEEEEKAQAERDAARAAAIAAEADSESSTGVEEAASSEEDSTAVPTEATEESSESPVLDASQDATADS